MFTLQNVVLLSLSICLFLSFYLPLLWTFFFLGLQAENNTFIHLNLVKYIMFALNVVVFNFVYLLLFMNTFFLILSFFLYGFIS